MRALPLLALVLLSACAHAPSVDPSPIAGPWDDAWVELPGRGDDGGPLRLHALVAGPLDGDLVVLLHGFPDFAYSWREVLPLLATDHRVHAVDLRGYGSSDAPQGGYDLFTVAGDIDAYVAAVLQAEGRPADAPVHLVGHDWGAAVGWVGVSANPERWTSFTAIDIPHGRTWIDYYTTTPAQRRASSYIGRLLGPGGARWIGAMDVDERAGIYRANLVRPEGFTEQDAARYHDAFGSPERLKPPIRYFQDIVFRRAALARVMRDAPAVQVPTLVLWGELDMYVLAPMAELSCEHVAAPCTAEVWPDVGHWLHWEDPAGVAARWRAFAADPQGTPATAAR